MRKYERLEDWKAVAAAYGPAAAGDRPLAKADLLPGGSPAYPAAVVLNWSGGLYRKPAPTRSEQIDAILASHGVRPHRRSRELERSDSPATIRRVTGRVLRAR